MFVTVEELFERMGMDSFTDAQSNQAERVIALAEQTIAGACSQDEAWITALNPVPPVVKVVCMELAVRAMANPIGVRFRQEQLGQYMLSESFIGTTGSMELTQTEQLRVRDAVFGQLSASPVLGSILDVAVDFNLPNRENDWVMLGDGDGEDPDD